MKDNFHIIEESFTFSDMGGGGCGCLPADGLRIMESPNILDFPVEGRKPAYRPRPLFLPHCPEGYVRDGQGCKLGESKPAKFSGFYGGNGEEEKEVAKGNITPENITAGLETAGAVLQLLGSKRALTEVEGMCGKQPKPLIGGKAKKQLWGKCASDYMQSKLNKEVPTGLSTGAIVGIALGSVALIGGIILLVVKLKPKVSVGQVAVTPAMAIAK